MLSQMQEAILGRMCQCKMLSSASITPGLLKEYNYSIMTGSYRFFRDSNDNLTGFVCWANVSRCTYNRFVTFGVRPNFINEWTEGDIRLVLDGTMTGTSYGELLSTFKKFVKSRHTVYCRNNAIVSLNNDTAERSFNRLVQEPTAMPGAPTQ